MGRVDLATPVKLYMVSFTKKIRFIVYIKKNNSIIPKSRSFEHRIRTQTQVLQIFKKFNMSQMNPKEVVFEIFEITLTWFL